MTVWIGRIEPSMWFEGAWWEQMLPDDVRLAVLSLGVGRLTPEQLERAHEQILDKVEVLDREGVDVINVGGSPVVTAYGMAGHARLVEEIGARVSRPFVTALQAELEGLRAVGGTRVAVASPYPIAQTERRLGILTGEGFVVAGHESLDIERNREIAMLDPGAVADLAVRVALAADRPDVVYLPCGSLPAPSVLDDIEARTGLPAVACAQAQVAACLRRVGYATPIEGYGRLLRDLQPLAA
jgi:maleate cis-trans isomerase